METFDIFFIFFMGTITGVFFSFVSMIIINADNSEKYPVGGFFPALLMFIDFPVESQIIVSGLLIMGGLTGFYISLSFWKEGAANIKLNVKDEKTDFFDSKAQTSKIEKVITVEGKSLKQFLK